jgi:hypothetical protein
MDPEDGDSVPSLLGTAANDSMKNIGRMSLPLQDFSISSFAQKKKLQRKNTVGTTTSHKSGSTVNFARKSDTNSQSPDNHKINSIASQRTNKPNVPRLDSIVQKNSNLEGRSPTRSGALGNCRHCFGTGNDVDKTEFVKNFNEEDAAPGDTKDPKLSGVKNGIFFYTYKASEVYKLSKVDA